VIIQAGLVQFDIAILNTPCSWINDSQKMRGPREKNKRGGKNMELDCRKERRKE